MKILVHSSFMHMCKYLSRVDTQKCNCWVIGYAHFLFLCPFKILIGPAKFLPKVAAQIYSLSGVHENSPHSHQLKFFFFFLQPDAKEIASGCVPLQFSDEYWVRLHFSDSCLKGACFGPGSSMGSG